MTKTTSACSSHFSDRIYGRSAVPFLIPAKISGIQFRRSKKTFYLPPLLFYERRISRETEQFFDWLISIQNGVRFDWRIRSENGMQLFDAPKFFVSVRDH